MKNVLRPKREHFLSPVDCIDPRVRRQNRLQVDEQESGKETQFSLDLRLYGDWILPANFVLTLHLICPDVDILAEMAYVATGRFWNWKAWDVKLSSFN